MKIFQKKIVIYKNVSFYERIENQCKKNEMIHALSTLRDAKRIRM